MPVLDANCVTEKRFAQTATWIALSPLFLSCPHGFGFDWSDWGVAESLPTLKIHQIPPRSHWIDFNHPTI